MLQFLKKMNFIKLCIKSKKKKYRNIKNMNRLFQILLKMVLFLMIKYNKKYSKLYNEWIKDLIKI